MMVITKDKINEISSLWSGEQINFRRQLEQSNNIQLQISQDDLKYLLLRLCDLREELDDAIACSID
ncbi:hypothetical protein [Megasphaera elsdenii]|uniref:hypothetical protein n=1 Tax=Megasphaera elsdenii TaxID=907 RepID=UPI000BA5694E|nr:hypothetical protein [Megasphaera elsdenii]MCI6749236.1 hypothetical protein [Megasphaera elsdenii]PAK19097.1 hypothetical protein CJO36_09025 [Megasphaera elsdenii]